MLFGQEHVDRYRATDGEEGHEWQGTTALLLTTDRAQVRRGAHHAADLPGARRRLPDRGLQGRRRRAPAWYRNLEAEPMVGVQVKGDKFTAKARTATSGEKPEMWRKMTGAWPAYDDYQTKTDREIPVVVLERA